MAKKRILLTGATGLLGRNLTFEFIKQNKSDLDDMEIIVLGRGQGEISLHSRLREIIMNDGLDYIELAENDVDDLLKFIDKNISCIEIDYHKDDLSISKDDFNKLKSKQIDLFFHIASITDFRDTAEVKSRLEAFNVEGTKRIVSLVESLDVKEFCYVGSAYSCGKTVGEIMPDYINLDQNFRNPYELTKLKAEIITRNFSKENGLKYRCFRPSTLCGRLIEQNLGKINKFDVFYGFGAFWLHAKSKMLTDIERIYDKPVHVDARIHYSMESGLNIVAADYAAKVMFSVCSQNIDGDSFHLANNNETPHSFYINQILDTLKINGVKYSDNVPENMNRLETFFYKTAGMIFAPYVVSGPMLFDTSNLDNVLSESNIYCPEIDDNNFDVLMDYAKKEYFGLAFNH